MQTPPKHADKLWYVILAASLLLNAYFYFNKNDKAKQVLASVEGRSFRWGDVSENSRNSFRQLDTAYYQLLKTEAEQWAANYVLPKEAQSKGVLIEELLKTEVSSKAQVSPEEVQERYAHSPSADSAPWPAVLKQIESEITNDRSRALREQYLAGLFTKYSVRFQIKPPAGMEPVEPAKAFTRFPLYQTPSDPRWPSRGSETAPLWVEVYSDFHCPFSKRFFSTLKEAEDQYPGQMRVVFHHFPLPIHPEAGRVHEASVCAQDQGKFWEFHDRLMTTADKPSKETLSAWASELGLDKTSFDACAESGKHKSWVAQEVSRGASLGVNSTPGYFINGRPMSGALPLEQLKPILDWHLKPSGQYPLAVQRPSTQRQAPSGPRLDPSKVYSFDPQWLKKGPSRGPENAPVTVVEFMDYNCPFCQKGSEIFDQVEAAYPGKIRLVAKNLPLPMHPNAAKAAEASLCADEQGKFWEFRKELFGGSWGKQTVQDMKEIAKKTGSNAARFAECLDSSKMKPAIDEDTRVINALGMAGTPTFFINGSPVVGAQPAENFKKVIDEKLAAK